MLNSRMLHASHAMIGFQIWSEPRRKVTTSRGSDMAGTGVLVITGGAGGMGLACARPLADRGHLVLVDVDERQLEEARSMLSADGASVETLQCDVTSAADVAAAADRV